MGKASWCPISWIHRCTDTRRRQFMKRAPACCSWRWSGPRICRALRVWRLGIKWFCWRSRGQRSSCWTQFSGACHSSRRAARSSLSPSIAQTTTTTRRLTANKTRCELKILSNDNLRQDYSLVQIAQDIRTLHDTLCRFKSILVDPAEFACLKAIVLFRSEAKGLKDATQIENLQDQAQVIDTKCCARWCVNWNPGLMTTTL